MLLSQRCRGHHWPLLITAVIFTVVFASPLAADLQNTRFWSHDATTTEPSHPDLDFTHATAYPVVRVVDGRNVVLLIQGQETAVRIISVDTLGTADPDHRAYDRGHPYAATRFTANLLRGESVYLEYEPAQGMRDSEGYLSAYLFRAPDGLFVNAEIIRQGFGKWRPDGGGAYRFTHLLRHYQQRARDSKKGLWAPVVKAISSEPSPLIAAAKNAPQAVRPLMVYVTPSGVEYHHINCLKLGVNSISMPLYKAITGYQPCSVCQPPE